MPILRCVETPDRLTEPSYDPAGEPPAALRRIGGSLWGLGEQATWVSGLVLALAAILVVVLRHWGVELPAAVPESLVVIALGSLSTILVLVRTISIPDEFFFAGRGIGLWISLAASVALIGAGLLQASEEL